MPKYIEETFWSNGKTHIIINYKNGLYHGLTKMFDVHGANDYNLNYKNGLKENVEKSWLPENKLWVVATHKNNIVNGMFFIFYY